MSNPISSLLLLFLLITSAQADCFRPNGTTRNSDPNFPNAYQPCSKTATNSMCCRTGDVGDNDRCRPDGLCSNGDLIWRESCTDPTWKSDACIKLCVSETLFFEGEPHSGTDVMVTECDNGSLCCGDPQTAGKPCCQQGRGVWLVEGKVYASNPSSTSASTTATSAPPTSSAGGTTFIASTTSPSTDTGATPSNQPSTKPSTSRDYTGVIAGCAVGGVVVLALLICALWWFTFYKNRSNVQQAPTTELHSSGYYGGDGVYKYAHTQSTPVYHEAPVDARHGRVELAGHETNGIK